MKQFVIKLKELNKFDLVVEGNIEEVIADPKAWAEKTAEGILAKEANRIKKAKAEQTIKDFLESDIIKKELNE